MMMMMMMVVMMMIMVMMIIFIIVAIILTFFAPSLFYHSTSPTTLHYTTLNYTTSAVNEGQGVILLKLKVGNYHQGIKLTVPPLYPEEGVTIEFLSSNFPKDMQYMFKCQG